MNGDAAGYIGSIPQDYDRSLGPLIFADYAADISHRVAACNPARVLETAAGTGIVTRRLRDVLPVSVRLTATDLNPPMLEIARTKFRAGEQVDFQPADATELPFADSSFDVVVCQFGVMFFPDKDKSYREVYRVLTHGGHYMFNIWDSHRHNPFGRIAHEVTGSFFPADPPQFQSVPFAARLGIKRTSFQSPPKVTAPHTRKPRLQPGKFSIRGTKRRLQHNQTYCGHGGSDPQEKLDSKHLMG